MPPASNSHSVKTLQHELASPRWASGPASDQGCGTSAGGWSAGGSERPGSGVEPRAAASELPGAAAGGKARSLAGGLIGGPAGGEARSLAGGVIGGPAGGEARSLAGGVIGGPAGGEARSLAGGVIGGPAGGAWSSAGGVIGGPADGAAAGFASGSPADVAAGRASTGWPVPAAASAFVASVAPAGVAAMVVDVVAGVSAAGEPRRGVGGGRFGERCRGRTVSRGELATRSARLGCRGHGVEAGRRLPIALPSVLIVPRSAAGMWIPTLPSRCDVMSWMSAGSRPAAAAAPAVVARATAAAIDSAVIGRRRSMPTGDDVTRAGATEHGDRRRLAGDVLVSGGP